MKKRIIVLLLVVAVVGVLLLNKKGIIDISGLLNSKAVLVSENDDLVGLWTMTNYKKQRSDSATVESSTLEIMKDGSCIYAYSIKVAGLYVGKHEGKCYVNKSKTRFKFVDNEGKEVIKWTKYTISDKTLKYDGYTYTKVR